MARITQAIIPVAGLGTRFLPVTKAQPKEMLPLVDKPVIQYVVEEAAEAGITSVTFVTGQGKASIENHFDRAYQLEATLKAKGQFEALAEIQNLNQLLQFSYVRQGEAQGLGHAVKCAQVIAGRDPVAVLLGDDVFTGERPALGYLLEAYEATGMTVVGIQEVPLAHVSRYGIVNGPALPMPSWAVDCIIEKPAPEDAPSRFAVVGRYILTPEVFEILGSLPPGQGGEYQLTDALAEMAKRHRLVAAVIPNRRFDTGNKLDYLKACLDFALARPEFRADLENYIIEKAATFRSYHTEAR